MKLINTSKHAKVVKYIVDIYVHASFQTQTSSEVREIEFFDLGEGDEKSNSSTSVS